MSLQTFVVGNRDVDTTVASFLRVRLNLPWSKIKKIVESGVVRVAGQKVVDPAHRLKLGKRVEVSGPSVAEPASEKPKPPPVTKSQKTKLPEAPKYSGPQPTIVYSDDSVVVVNKPAGLTTMRHAEEAAEFGEKGKKFLPTTLADLLPGLLGMPGKAVRAVHRIDRDTTGLVVFARNKIAEKKLNDQFKFHTVERRYFAIVRGSPKAGKIESLFVRDRGDGRRGSAEPTEDSQKAITNIRVVERLGEAKDFALVECRLETGRTHQVRIHLGESGWPLCGEKVYDRPLNGQPVPDRSMASRPMLHAAKLGFTHPITEDRMEWDCPLPIDMQKLLDKLRG